MKRQLKAENADTAPALPKSGGTGRLFGGALLAALALYAGGYGLDRHLRTRHGPWAVTFIATASSAPRLRVEQAHLQIHDVEIVFVGERTAPVTNRILFDQPRRPVPFGRVKYDDLTYWPGVVTLECFGHELELLPRALYVNRKPVPWDTVRNLELAAQDKPGALLDPPVRGPSHAAER